MNYKTKNPKHTLPENLSENGLEFAMLRRQHEQHKVRARINIDDVFKIELLGMNVSMAGEKEIKKRYAFLVNTLINKIVIELDPLWKKENVQKEKADHGLDYTLKHAEELAQKTDERLLLYTLSKLFHGLEGLNIGSHDEGIQLYTAIKTDKFCCYSSSILLADVLTKLGKNIEIIATNKHMFLATERYILESTHKPDRAVNQRVGYLEHIPNFIIVNIENLPMLTWYNKGGRLMDLGRYKESIIANDNVLKYNSKDVNALYNLAVALYKIGKDSEACHAYEKLLEINPNDLLARENLCELLVELGQNKKASEHLERLNLILPKNIKNMKSLAFLYMKLKQYENAVELFYEVIELNFNDAELWTGKGNAEYMLERYEDAIYSYNKAIELEERYIEPIHGKSRCLIKMGRPIQAVTTITKSVFTSFM